MNINIVNLDFAYIETAGIFRSLNLIFDDKQINVIYGSSGAGKSTLYKLITGDLIPNEGRIQIFLEKDEVVGSLSQMHNKVGYVTQQNQMMAELTMLENLLIKFSFDITQNTSNVQIQDIQNKIDNYTKILNIHELLNFKPDEISMGEFRRFMVVNSLLYEPKILIMDEPTANLDFPNRVLIERLLKVVHENGNILIIIFTHDIYFRETSRQFRCYNINKQNIELMNLS